MPSPAILFSGCPCVRSRITLKVREHDVLQTACWNFIKFTSLRRSWRRRWRD